MTSRVPCRFLVRRAVREQSIAGLLTTAPIHPQYNADTQERPGTPTSATAVKESDYSPFGGERVVVNNDPNAYKFTGKERDSESSLDYFGALYYASLAGRFQSPDLPFVDQHPANPQSWNLYAYSRNNNRHAPETWNSYKTMPMEGGSDLSGGPAPTLIIEVDSPGQDFNSSAPLSAVSKNAIENQARKFGYDPAKFEAAVLSAANQYNLNPNLLVGLAMRESSMNPYTKPNRYGAAGLFQLVPTRQKDLGISGSEVYDYQVQIPKVAEALSKAMQRYNGDVDRVIASWALGDRKMQRYYNKGGMPLVRSLELYKGHPHWGRVGPEYIDFVEKFF